MRTTIAGIWRHYKGGTYVAMGIARHHDTGELGVVYHGTEPHGTEMPSWNWRPMTGQDGWLTPLTQEEYRLWRCNGRPSCPPCDHPHHSSFCICPCHPGNVVPENLLVRFVKLVEVLS